MGLKAPGNYFALIWINKISIRWLENQQTLISMISGFSTRHQAPKPILFIFGYTSPPKQNQENLEKHVQNTSCSVNLKMLETHVLSIWEKMGAEKWWSSVKSNLEKHGYDINIPLKTWFGNSVDFWNQETIKPYSQKTIKPRNYKTINP